MTKRLRFWLAVLANMSPVFFSALFYKSGAPGIWSLLMVSHILLYLLNQRSACTWKQLAFLGVEHILSTLAAHLLYSYLYNRFICDDIPGRAIGILGLWVGVFLTIILLAVSLIMWHRKRWALQIITSKVINMDRENARRLLAKWAGKLRVTPGWEIALEFVEDPAWRKTGDIKIDCDDKKAIVLLNAANPKQENMEEVLVHELLHLKMYPLDQVTESLITAHYPVDSPERGFAYNQFFNALEQTVEELTKCYLLEFGENKELSFGRCRGQASFLELYDGLRNLE